MSRLVFLLEEPSMKALLEGLLPRLFPDLRCLFIVHEVKQDLEKSIPRKLRGWKEPGVRFMIVRDNDGGDCRALKTRLAALFPADKRGTTLVRIACQELEAWYLGDPEALAMAFRDDRLKNFANKPKYRDPDAVAQPSTLVARLAPGFQKISGARRMAPHLDLHRNRSTSFHHFIRGIAHMTGRMPPRQADDSA